MSYGVIFHALNGTNGTRQQVISNGIETPLNANVFSKYGYDFMGWSTAPFEDAVYSDGETVLDLAPNGSAISLYAVWEPAVYSNGKYILRPLTAAAIGTIDGDTTLTEDYAMATAYSNSTLHIYSVDNMGNAGTKTITENGTYNAEDDSWGGYSTVTVEVPVPQYANLDNQRF